MSGSVVESLWCALPPSINHAPHHLKLHGPNVFSTEMALNTSADRKHCHIHMSPHCRGFVALNRTLSLASSAEELSRRNTTILLELLAREDLRPCAGEGV